MPTSYGRMAGLSSLLGGILVLLGSGIAGNIVIGTWLLLRPATSPVES